MKLNEQLLQQVREGKASIEYNGSDADFEKLDKLTAYIFPKDDWETPSYFRYYFCHDQEGSEYMMFSNTTPTGLTPIPLDDFFKVEKVTHVLAYGLTTKVWTLKNGKYGCSECCFGDCDCDIEERCTVRGGRKNCKHCKGMGWIPETEATPIPLDRFFEVEWDREQEDILCLVERCENGDIKRECKKHCGMSYCDEYGCINGKTGTGELAPKPPAPDHVPDTGNMMEVPEVLVSEHIEAIRSCAEYTSEQESKSHSSITIDYMGRFAEWCAANAFDFTSLGWYRRNALTEHYYTTTQLITLFFNSNPKS